MNSALFKNLGLASGLDGLNADPTDPVTPFTQNAPYAFKPKGGPMPSANRGPLVSGGIPLPDYNDPKSRLQYAQAFRNKYGPYMQGRGDAPLRINEVPNVEYDRLPIKQSAINAVDKFGMDPALFYASAMEEGVSGMFKKGYEGEGYFNSSSYSDYPVSGFAGVGLDHFANVYPGLVKKGYLSEDFKSKFKPTIMTNEKGEETHSGDFRSVEDAMTAKGAMAKDSEDQVLDYAKRNNIQLSPAAKQFFTYVNYNAGEGNAQKMLMDYHRAGALKGDAFMKSRPSSGGALKENSWKQPYDNVMRRVKMAEALRKEGYFNDQLPKQRAPRSMQPMQSPAYAYSPNN
jgi:hypothetical protein